MFYIMDKDKNGNLTLEELKDGSQNMGSFVAEPHVQMLMEAVSAPCRPASVDGQYNFFDNAGNSLQLQIAF